MSGVNGVANGMANGATSGGGGSFRRALPASVSEQLDKERLEGWLRYHTDPARGKYQCQCFKLQARDADDPMTHLFVPKSLDGAGRAAEIARVVDEVDHESRQYASTEPHKVAFDLMAITSMDPNDAVYISTSFVVTPTPDQTRGFRETQSPGSSTGGLAGVASEVINNQSRQLDNAHRLIVDFAEQIKDMLHASQQREESLARERAELWRAQQEMADRTLDREIARRDRAIEQDIHHQLFTGAIGWGKALLGKVAEQKFGIAAGASPLDAMRDYAAKLSPEQLLMFVQLQPPEMRDSFIPIGRMLVQAWPIEKQQAFDALFQQHAELEAAQQAQPTQQTQPTPQPAPPQTQPTPSEPAQTHPPVTPDAPPAQPTANVPTQSVANETTQAAGVGASLPQIARKTSKKTRPGKSSRPKKGR